MAKTRCNNCFEIVEPEQDCPECGEPIRYPRTVWEDDP